MARATARARHPVEKGRGLSDEAQSREAPEGAAKEKAGRTLEFPSGSETDAELVRRARRGDRSAFESLVRRHLKAAYPVAAARLPNPRDAEDVCQDAFVTALEKLDTCERPEHFRAWFLTIVRNRAHNFRKYEEVRQTQPLEQARIRPGPFDPARDLDRAELRARIETALEGLTDLQRQVVVLHDYEGRKHGEIGSELGISPGASRFHLHVARKRLRKELADLVNELPGGHDDR